MMERNEFHNPVIIPTKYILHGLNKENRLFAYNESVDNYNMNALNRLPSEPVEYKANDEGRDIYLKQLQKNCQAPSILTLKVGAQVMLLKNLSVGTGLVNGTRGVVDSFVKDVNVYSIIILIISLIC